MTRTSISAEDAVNFIGLFLKALAGFQKNMFTAERLLKIEPALTRAFDLDGDLQMSI